MEPNNPPVDTNRCPSDPGGMGGEVDHTGEDGGGSDTVRHVTNAETASNHEETKVIYHIDDEETPYKVTVSASNPESIHNKMAFIIITKFDACLMPFSIFWYFWCSI